MLKIDPQWEEDSPGPILPEVFQDFLHLIHRMSGKAARPQRVLELFKREFAACVGKAASPSSSESWAATDMENMMSAAAENAALFIQAFCSGCENLRTSDPEFPVPSIDRINRILGKHNAAFRVEDGALVTAANHRPVQVPTSPPSLDEQAHEVIQAALSQSDNHLAKGQGRQAVAELLWVLESVSTGFDGAEAAGGTIKGKYFNTIVKEMQAKSLSAHQRQVLTGMVTLHGYLSSPTGGGIRHGQDLQKGTPLTPNDALVFCNIIRSYITYMLSEHERYKRN